MALDASKVILATPDQTKTTGAIAVAKKGTLLPNSATEKLGQGWDAGGYVSSDGVTVSTSIGTTDIKDWSQATVRKAITDFSGSISFKFLQTDEFTLKRLLGPENVDVASDGKKITAKFGAHLPEIESYTFSMKDGDLRVRIIVPSGQFTSIEDFTFTPGDATTFGGTLSCYDDDGYSIMIIFEDGTVITDADAN